jgi:hypothetical protein
MSIVETEAHLEAMLEALYDLFAMNEWGQLMKKLFHFVVKMYFSVTVCSNNQ